MSAHYESLLRAPARTAATDAKRVSVRPFAKAPLLGTTDRQRVSSSLVALRVGKRSERLAAARELGDIAATNGVRLPEAVLPLTVTLASDADSAVRKEAAWSLWKFGDDRAQRPLIKAMIGDPSIGVRARAARALGFLGAADALPLMLDLLSLGRHVPARLRAALAAALGFLSDEKALPLLLKATDDADPSVRAEAIRALGRYCIDSAPQIADAAFRRLERCAAHRHEPQPAIRQAAVKGLRLSPRERAGIVVSRVLAHDPDPETRAVAADALPLWSHPLIEQRLVGALADDFWPVRKVAAAALARAIVRHRVHDSAAVCEALTRIRHMFPSTSPEARLAREALDRF